jgi:hypothetical protein
VRISAHLVAAIALALSFGQQSSAPAQEDASAERDCRGSRYTPHAIGK